MIDLVVSRRYTNQGRFYKRRHADLATQPEQLRAVPRQPGVKSGKATGHANSGPIAYILDSQTVVITDADSGVSTCVTGSAPRVAVIKPDGAWAHSKRGTRSCRDAMTTLQQSCVAASEMNRQVRAYDELVGGIDATAGR